MTDDGGPLFRIVFVVRERARGEEDRGRQTRKAVFVTRARVRGSPDTGESVLETFHGHGHEGT
jgi:hypothetical protein